MTQSSSSPWASRARANGTTSAAGNSRSKQNPRRCAADHRAMLPRRRRSQEGSGREVTAVRARPCRRAPRPRRPGAPRRPRGSGSTRSTTGRTRPAATSGHTFSTTDATIAAFSADAAGRAGWSRGRRLACAAARRGRARRACPPCRPMTHEPPVDGEDVDVAAEVGRAHVVEDDVGAVAVRGGAHLGDEVLLAVVDEDLGAELGAPGELLGGPGGDGDPRAERRRRAGWPSCRCPDDPPCTSRTSPGWSPASMKTLDHTVHATSGSAAALTRSTPAGTGISWPAGTATRSA